MASSGNKVCVAYRRLLNYKVAVGVLLAIIIVLLLMMCGRYRGGAMKADEISFNPPQIVYKDKIIEKTVYVPKDRIVYRDRPVTVTNYETVYDVESVVVTDYVTEYRNIIDETEYPVQYGDAGLGIFYPLGGGLDGRYGLKFNKYFGLGIGTQLSSQGWLVNAGPSIFLDPFRFGVHGGMSHLFHTKTWAPEMSAYISLALNRYIALEVNTNFAMFLYIPTDEKLVRHLNSGIYAKWRF